MKKWIVLIVFLLAVPAWGASPAFMGGLKTTIESGCVLGPEAYVFENAASIINEADDITGFGGNNATLASQNTYVSDGLYAIESATTVNTGRVFTTIQGTVGKYYKLTFDLRHIGSGGDWYAFIGGSPDPRVERIFGFPNITSSDTVFNSNTIYFYQSPTDYLLDAYQLTFIENSGTNDGGVYVDKISLKEIEDPVKSAEMHSGSADSPDDTDSIGNWTVSYGTLVSQSSIVNAGTYALEFQITANGAIAALDLDDTYSLEDGAWYELTFAYRHTGVGGSVSIEFRSFHNFSRMDIGNTYTDWVQYRNVFKYDQNNGQPYDLRFYDSNATDDGGMYIDNVSLKKVTFCN